MPFPFTRQGFDKAKEELNHLTTVLRPCIIAEFADAKETGDPEEDTGIQAVQEEQDKIDKRIAELQEMISDAKVILPDLTNLKTVSFGSTVELFFIEKNMNISYTIVGSYETDPAAGMISYLSPLGGQLLNKEIGDEVSVSTGKYDSTYEILSIKFKKN